MKNKRKGISLIALIIVIIVMVILVAVVLSNITSGTDSARKARFFSDISTINEAVTLAYTKGYSQNPNINMEDAIPNNGKITESELKKIESKYKTLQESIERLNNRDSIYERNLYWLNTDELGVSVSQKSNKYLIDMESLVVYDYVGSTFFEERWHTINFGVKEHNEEEEKTEDGYARLTLEYPEGSINRQYAIIRVGESKAEANWLEYTGPILIKLEDIQYVNIRYNLNGEDKIKVPDGTLLVNIKPDLENSIETDKVKINIEYDEEAEIKQYKVGNSSWIDYDGEFIVTENVIIEARAYKTVTKKDENGNIVDVVHITGKDKYVVRNIKSADEDDTLEAPTVTVLAADTEDEKARVEIIYPEVADRLVYKLNSGEEKEYDSILSINKWGVQVNAYYYTVDGRKSKSKIVTIKDTENLDLEIYLNPNPQVNKAAVETTIEIEYDDSAIKRQYKIDDGQIKDYIGSFVVKENCKITAYEEDAVGRKKNISKTVKFSDKEIYEPVITETVNSDKTSAKISIEYPGEAIKKTYKIITPKGEESEELEYTGEFEITEDGTIIYAVSENIVGEQKATTHTVYLSMIRPVIIASVNSNKTEATVTISYDASATRKSYKVESENGENIVSLRNYTESFKVTENRCKIIAEEENDRGTIIREEYVVNMDMINPVISQNIVVEGTTKKAVINIVYDESAIDKKYKIINKEGIESEFINYTDEFEVTENGTVIYAIGKNARGEVKDATYTVKIEMDEPKFNVTIVQDSENNDMANVEIIYDAIAISKKYSINDGEEKEYTGAIPITENLTKVIAIEENEEGERKQSEKVVEIAVATPVVNLEISEDKTVGIVTITYDQRAIAKTYTIDEGTSTGKITEEYTGPILVKLNGTKIVGTNSNKAGDTKTSEELIVSGIEETLGSRFEEPVIIGTIVGEKSNINIKYDTTAIRKQYKIITKDGTESEFIDYTVPFDVEENDTIIYAEEENEVGIVKGATYTVGGIIKNIPIEIIVNPEIGKDLEEVEVAINYGESATRKSYKIVGENVESEYNGPFKVTKNCTIVATAIGDNSKGTATKRITNLKDGLIPPEITVEKVEIENGEYANVTIVYDEDSTITTYSLDEGEEIEYTGSITITQNGTNVVATSIDSYGNVATSSEIINLNVYSPSVVIQDKIEYKIVLLNYPEQSTNRMYKYTETGEWKEYDEYGFVLIEEKYQEELLSKNPEVNLKTSDGNIHSYKNNYYIYDGVLYGTDKIFMKWDVPAEKKEKPKILPLQAAPLESVDLVVVEPKNAVKTEYKIASGEWTEYTGIITVTKNYTTVYARSTFEDGEIKTASYYIKNLQVPEPDGDIEITYTPTEYTSEVEVTIKFNPKYASLMNRYKISNESWKETTNSEMKFKVTKNTTVYGSFKNGNGKTSSAVTLKITNIDVTKPSVSISGPNISSTYGTNNIEYKIVVNDEVSGSGICISKCKYVYDKYSTIYSVDDEIWNTASIMTATTENVKVNATLGSGKYYLHVLAVDNAGNKTSRTSSYRNIDADEPLDAKIVFDNSLVSPGEKITASVEFEDNVGGSGNNIKSSKYIFSTKSTKYGVDNTIWNTANTFEIKTSKQAEDITLSASSTGTYYLHVLSVDKVGNKHETVSAKVIVEPDGVTYVSPNGSDSTGNGTRSNPYKTYEKAINSISSGKICLMEGTHTLSSLKISNYSSAGIYDYGKNVEIYGYNEKTILVYDGTTSSTRDGNAVSLYNSSSKLRNVTYKFYPQTTTSKVSSTATKIYRGAIFNSIAGDVYNVHFYVYNTGTRYTSLYYGPYSNTHYGSLIKNCSFYFSSSPNRSHTNFSSSTKTFISFSSCLGNYCYSSSPDSGALTIFSGTNNLESMKNSSYGVYNGAYAWPK